MKKILTVVLAVAFVISIVASLSASSDVTVYTQSRDAGMMALDDGTTKMLSSGYGFHKMTTRETFDGFTWSNELRVNSVDAANTDKAYWGVSFSEAGNDFIGYWFADKKFKVVVDGVTLAEKDFDWQLLENKWYDIMIRKFGDTVTLYCDNAEMVSASSDVFDGKYQLSFSNDGIDLDIGCIGILMGEDFNILDRQYWRKRDDDSVRDFRYYNFSVTCDHLYKDLPKKEIKNYEDRVYLSRFENDFILAAENDYVVTDIGYVNWTWADTGTYYYTGSTKDQLFAGYWFDSQRAGLTYDVEKNLFDDASTWPSQANAPFTWNEGDTHILAVRRVGATISVLIDGNVIASYNNPGCFDEVFYDTTAEDPLFFWSRYLSYRLDNLIFKDLVKNKEIINLDFSEDLVDENGDPVNKNEEIGKIFLDKTDYQNGVPGMIIIPRNPDNDGINRYCEYDADATDRAMYQRKLYWNSTRNPDITDFEVSAEITITRIKEDSKVVDGSPAGIGFRLFTKANADSGVGFGSNEGRNYDRNNFTFSADILMKDTMYMGLTDREKRPDDGATFYMMVGGTAGKGAGTYAAGYDAQNKKMFLRYLPGDSSIKDVLDPVPVDWPLDEWVTFTVQLRTAEDEFGTIPELAVYVNGQEIYTYQEEALCAARSEIGEEKLGSLFLRKFDIQLAMKNVVVTDGKADITADAFKLGCKNSGGHVWNDGVVTLEATTKAEGAKLYTCQYCAQTKTEVLAKLSETPVIPGNSDSNNNNQQGGSEKDDNKANPGTSSGDVYALSSITALLGGAAVVAKKKFFE